MLLDLEAWLADMALQKPLAAALHATWRTLTAQTSAQGASAHESRQEAAAVTSETPDHKLHTRLQTLELRAMALGSAS